MNPEQQKSLLAITLYAAFADGAKHDRERVSGFDTDTLGSFTRDIPRGGDHRPGAGGRREQDHSQSRRQLSQYFA